MNDSSVWESPGHDPLHSSPNEGQEGLLGTPWEVMRATLVSVAIMACGLGYLAAAYVAVVYHSDPRWEVFLPAVALAGGGATVLVRRTHYRTRALLILSALFTASLLGDIILREPQAQLSYVLVCIVAGALLGPVPSTVVGVLATLSLVVQALPPSLRGIPWWTLTYVWLGVAVVWAAMGNLYLAVSRAIASAEWAWGQVQEARLRRGELHSVVRSLEEATYRIERMNHELNQARMEAELAKANKSRFVVTVSHEFRGPLNLILGFSRLMALSPERYGTPLPSAYRADVDAIYRNSEHMAALIDDVIDLARIEAERLPLVKEATSLYEDVVGEAVDIVRPLAERKGLFLRLCVEDDVPTVLADPVRLRQVLLNLLVNAVRHTDRGGITVTMAVQGEHVIVRVHDTGSGIAPDDLPHLFREFGQVSQPTGMSQQGSGLGLSISKYLVELHGGEMHVESTQGIGTTFYFTLPLPHARVPVPAAIRTAAAKRAQPADTCLVVHDDPFVVRLLARHMEGYHVVGVSEPCEVGTLVAELHPRAIIAAPEVSTVIEQRLAQGTSDVPIISCPMARASDRPQLQGLVSYLIKPISHEMLSAAMRKVVRDGQTRILIVDDDLDAARLLETMLTALPYHYDITKAHDGEQALEMMREAVPDVVLLDLVMPNLDGEETLARMRADALLRDIPVIAVSARDYAEGTTTIRTPITVSHRNPLEATRGIMCLKALVDALSPSYLAPPATAAPSPEASRG